MHPGEEVLNKLKDIYTEAPDIVKFYFADIVNSVLNSDDPDLTGGLYMTTLPFFGYLSDTEIKKENNLISPFIGKKVKENVEYSFGLEPFGYTFRLGIDYFDYKEKKIADKEILIPSLGSLIISTLESVKLPKSVTGFLWGKSSYIRKGLIFTFGVVDAGYSGTLSFSIFNSSPLPVTLKVGEGICQIIMYRSSAEPEKAYEGKYDKSVGVNPQ